MNMLPQGVRLSRAERKAHIMHEIRNSSSVWHTVASLSRLTNMAASSHLRGMLLELVDEGQLHEHVNIGSGSWWHQRRIMSRWYCLPSRDPRRALFK